MSELPGRDAGGRQVGATIAAYFPRGRVAGAPVVFTVGTYGGGLATAMATLDATRSARDVTVRDPDCGSGITGDLLGPSDGFEGVATQNLSAPSDALATISGRVKLCASGGVPAQKLQPVPEVFAPYGTIHIRGTRPFDVASFASITAMTSRGHTALRTTDLGAGVALSALKGTFSLFEPTTLDLSGLRDVLGDSLALTSVKSIVPSTTVTDLTFASEPPAGALLGYAKTEDGVLRTSEAVVIAIDGSTGSRMRIRHRLDCVTDSTASWSVSIVAADGSSTALAPKCSATMAEETVVLPGSGPRAILAGPIRATSRPCNYPTRSEPSTYLIDEVIFE